MLRVGASVRLCYKQSQRSSKVHHTRVLNEAILYAGMRSINVDCAEVKNREGVGASKIKLDGCGRSAN